MEKVQLFNIYTKYAIGCVVIAWIFTLIMWIGDVIWSIIPVLIVCGIGLMFLFLSYKERNKQQKALKNQSKRIERLF